MMSISRMLTTRVTSKAVKFAIARNFSTPLNGTASIQTTPTSTATPGQKKLKVAFFDARSYWKPVFNVEHGYPYADLKMISAKLDKDTAQMARGCEVASLFVNDNADADTLEVLHGHGVRLIVLRAAGFNNVDLSAAKRLGISVTRVPAYSPHAVAEFALTLLLALNRKICKSYIRTRAGNFCLSGLVGWDIYGKTIGVIGTGKIGMRFAKIMLGMGCKVLCQDKYENPELKGLEGLTYVPLEELLKNSDVISMHTPLTASTHHLINDDTIAMMKTGVYIINTSRGKLIDSECLIKAIKSGKLAGAGLDVYEWESEYFFKDRSDENIEDETLVRLLSFNNVIITSHQSFLTEQALHNIAECTMESIRLYAEGKRFKELPSHIDADTNFEK